PVRSSENRGDFSRSGRAAGREVHGSKKQWKQKRARSCCGRGILAANFFLSAECRGLARLPFGAVGFVHPLPLRVSGHCEAWVRRPDSGRSAARRAPPEEQESRHSSWINYAGVLQILRMLFARRVVRVLGGVELLFSWLAG